MYQEPPIRHCCVCDAEIRECMGFCLARDVLESLETQRPVRVRELCWRCADTVDPATIKP
jgi:hypothetical protein